MKIYIDDIEHEASENETILEVANRVGVEIPTLCYMKDFCPSGSCRMCLVEVIGQKNLITACNVKVFDKMEVLTNSERVKTARRLNLELLLSNHNYDCDNCVKNGVCKLQKYAKDYNADENRFKGEKTKSVIDSSSPAILRDNSKCILCKKCVAVCSGVQSVNAIKETKRGFDTTISTAFNKGLKNSSCVGCGQCVKVCPTGALVEALNINEANNILNDNFKVKVAIIAPAVKVAIMELFGISEPDVIPTLLRELGFNYVFDITYGADLTIIEESKELLARLENGKNLPLFSSCCPSWVSFQNKFYPEFKNNVSSCKSPMMMVGNLIKTYWAEKIEFYGEVIKTVAIMPCTSKKEEILTNDDIDVVLTVKELEFMLKSKNVNVKLLKPSKYDRFLGESSGAGVIFGSSGGVMGAVVRHLTGSDISFEECDKIKGLKLANVKLGAGKIVVGIVSGLSNAKTVLEEIKKNNIKLHFVEVMSCEGGCVNGGGMPNSLNSDVVKKRAIALKQLDEKNNLINKPMENREIIEFLEWQKTAKGKAKLHNK